MGALGTAQTEGVVTSSCCPQVSYMLLLLLLLYFFAKSSSYQSTLRFSSHLLEVLSKHNRQLLASTPSPGISMFNIIFLIYADGFAENLSFLSHACTQSPPSNYCLPCLWHTLGSTLTHPSLSQKIAGNPHPVYLKSNPGQDFYLYFRDQGKVFSDSSWILLQTRALEVGWSGSSFWKMSSF